MFPCKTCGIPIDTRSDGKGKRYCSTECNPVKRGTFVIAHCRQCGEVFSRMQCVFYGAASPIKEFKIHARRQAHHSNGK